MHAMHVNPSPTNSILLPPALVHVIIIITSIIIHVPVALVASTPLSFTCSLYVPQVRTKDDALIVVKLMIFFELRDIEVMVQCTLYILIMMHIHNTVCVHVHCTTQSVLLQ